MNPTNHTISAEFLAMLRCPETASALTIADDELLSRLNQSVSDGELLNAIGQRIEKPLDLALVNADGTLAYAVIDNIPLMVPGEAIRISAGDSTISKSIKQR